MLYAPRRAHLGPALPQPRSRAAPRRAVHLKASASSISFAPEDVNINRALGEGSFGQVFEGTLRHGDMYETVVLKRIKSSVEGAQDMAEVELALNEYANKAAPAACAHYLGHIRVHPSHANKRLTEGLWLVWQAEGRRSLAYFLQRRNPLQVLAQELGISVQDVVPTVMKQLLQNLYALHSAGLVHRDVKPANLVLAQAKRKFVLVDLGAAVNLRRGTNYRPDESMMDPAFCPPEQYVLPTDTPDLALSRIAQTLSPLLWARHKPDRFDTWCAGMVMLQLCFSSLRSNTALLRFKKEFAAAGYDLAAWRQAAQLPAAEAQLLDQDSGAGWQLLQALLRPRAVQKDGEGGVAFKDSGSLQRASAKDALGSRFMRLAVKVEPTSERQASPAKHQRPGSPGAAAAAGSSAEEQEQGPPSLTSLLRLLPGPSMAHGAAPAAEGGSAGRSRSRSGGREDAGPAEGGGSSESSLTALLRQLARSGSPEPSPSGSGSRTRGNTAGADAELGVGSSLTQLLRFLPGSAKAVASSAGRGAGSGSGAGHQGPGLSGTERMRAELGTVWDSAKQVAQALVRARSRRAGSTAAGAAGEQQQAADLQGVLRLMRQLLVSQQQAGAQQKRQLLQIKAEAQAAGDAATAKKVQQAERMLDQMVASIQQLRQKAAAFMPGSRGISSSSSSSRAAAAAGGQQPHLSAADQAVYAGLKLSGAAVSAAAGALATLKGGVSRAAEEWAAADGQQTRALDVAFFEMLRQSVAPITGGTTFQQVQQRFAVDPRFLAVPEPRRLVLFGAYLEALAAKVAGAARQQQRRLASAIIKAADEGHGEEMERELGELRAQQERMQAEYDRLAAELAEVKLAMEGREMAQREAVAAAAAAAAPAADPRHAGSGADGQPGAGQDRELAKSTLY